MAKIILNTDTPDRVLRILKETLHTEMLRVRRSLELTRNHLERFEGKYNISSETFISEWSAEDLEGGDMEYIEWAGEYRIATNLTERIEALERGSQEFLN